MTLGSRPEADCFNRIDTRSFVSYKISVIMFSIDTSLFMYEKNMSNHGNEVHGSRNIPNYRFLRWITAAM